ncbi:3-hydroxyacyl-CoA dehydrogenase NAD-binding domain-containing protein [Microvirga sp. TS319]|uniref:3-hydroxyacyl-CoA dehydrogenase NAD-binding domain-containing protein n=1 Tax=Microvirga sp. TS319 TaxID=3241165 RepID=UPI00351A80EE
MDGVAIVGRGIIGTSWALVFARAGLGVSIWDRAGLGEAKIISDLQASATSLIGTNCAVPPEAFDRIRVHRELRNVLRGARYVQESAPEVLALKRELLRQIADAADPGTIIASSTSGLRPSELADGVAARERFLVVHPLTPPHLLPLTEVVPSPFTSEEVVEHACAFMTEVGQTPVRLLRETPGFVANRVLGAMLNEFFHLVREEVIRPQDVDTIITQGFGLRWACMGPFAAMDLNAPGGIADYLSRYGGIFEKVAKERNASGALDDALIKTLAEAMRAEHSLDANPARAALRDRSIAHVREVRTVVP